MTKNNLKCKVDRKDLEDLVFLSFRYALPRHTYVTAVVRDLVIKYMEHMSKDILEKIIKEIDYEITNYSSMWQCDIEVWTTLKTSIKTFLTEEKT